jgi:hypothetical protein
MGKPCYINGFNVVLSKTLQRFHLEYDAIQEHVEESKVRKIDFIC